MPVVTVRPRYEPQFGHTRCGRRGVPQEGQLCVPGFAALCCDRRLVLRLCDCFCLGTAMAEPGYRTSTGYEVRPPVPSDAPALARLSIEAFGATEDRAEEVVGRRAARLLEVADPCSRVAELPTGELIGLAISRRIGESLLLAWAVVAPALQGRGVLRSLLHPFPQEPGLVPRVILSSTDPRAMRRYALLQLPAHPTLGACGILRPGAAPAVDGARQHSPLEARELIDSLGVTLRGAGYGADVDLMAQQGDVAHVIDDGASERAVVIRNAGVVRTALATTPAAGEAALRAALHGVPPGATVHLNFIRAGQDWILRPAVDAGLALSPEGPVFSDRPLHALHLPNGSLG